MKSWHERAVDEIEQCLEEGLIDEKEYRRQLQDIRSEMRMEAEDAAQRAYDDAMGY